VSDELSKNHSVIVVDRKELLHGKASEIRLFNPDVLHYFSSVSTLGFPFVKLVSKCVKTQVSVISALNPGSLFLRKTITVTKPDLIIVQSTRSELLFKKLGCKTAFIPSGVDISKFRPVKYERKVELRKEYGIAVDDFVILHVGHIRSTRNLTLFSDLQGKNCQVIIVGSQFDRVERKLYEELKMKGCILWVRYFDDIEKIYEMADCYVFPTIDETGGIGVPLSVLEAMACNLPVITTPFGGIPRLFHEGQGLVFLRDPNRLSDSVANMREFLKAYPDGPRTREKVLPFSWDKIANRLESLYELELLDKKRE
jgi:glycosyltransferase involved in cell wall biosynthesis